MLKSIRYMTGIALFSLAAVAQAGAILSPTAVIQNTAGNDSAVSPIQSAIDQSGLTLPFVSGVTDFDTYIASAPTHSWIYTDGAEWFSVAGMTIGTVDFDLGAVYRIDRLALWNEEFSGLQTLRVTTSNDSTFAVGTVVANVNPTDSPFDQNYGAEVFGLLATDARYVRFEMTGPQTPNRGIYLSMGEVAFDVQAVVPVPGTLALLLAGMIGFGAARRRGAV